MTNLKSKIIVSILLVLALVLCEGCGIFDSPLKTNENQAESGEPPSSDSAAPVTMPVPVRDDLFSVGYESGSSLNPVLSDSQTNLMLSGMIYESLFKVNPDFSYEALLCESFSTEDGIHYRFTIKTGIQMHDGSTLTLYDVIGSIEMARESGRFTGRLAIISEVYIDDGDVCITLRRPNMNLPLLLDIPIMKDSTCYINTPVGSGLYIPVLNSQNGEYLTAFTQHRDYEHVPIQKITLNDCSPSDIISAFEDATLDMVVTNKNKPGYVEFSGNIEKRTLATTEMHFLGFNPGRGFCSSSARRLIISSVIDRAYLTTTMMEGTVPTVLPVHPSSGYYLSDVAETALIKDDFLAEFMERNFISDYNKDGKLEYIEGSRENEIYLDFIVNKDNLKKLNAAKYITSELQKLGFDVRLRELPWENFILALENEDYDIYYGSVRLTNDFDLSELFRSGGSVNYGIYDEKLAGHIDNFNAAGPANKDEKIFYTREMLRYISDNAYIAPLLFENMSIFTHRGVCMYMSPTQDDIFHNFIEWEINLNGNG